MEKRNVLPEEWVALVKNTCGKFEDVAVTQDIILNFNDNFSKMFKEKEKNRKKY